MVLFSGFITFLRPSNHRYALLDQLATSLDKIWVSRARAPILNKYELVLDLKKLPRFDKGAPPYQNADLLIAVRNGFVHFYPEWHDNQARHKKLGDRLAGKFDLSPFMAEGTAVMFPQRIVGHGCTQWAVKSALAFMEEFSKRVSLLSRFQNHHQHLAP